MTTQWLIMFLVHVDDAATAADDGGKVIPAGRLQTAALPRTISASSERTFLHDATRKCGANNIIYNFPGTKLEMPNSPSSDNNSPLSVADRHHPPTSFALFCCCWTGCGKEQINSDSMRLRNTAFFPVMKRMVNRTSHPW